MPRSLHILLFTALLTQAMFGAFRCGVTLCLSEHASCASHHASGAHVHLDHDHDHSHAPRACNSCTCEHPEPHPHDDDGDGHLCFDLMIDTVDLLCSQRGVASDELVIVWTPCAEVMRTAVRTIVVHAPERAPPWLDRDDHAVRRSLDRLSFTRLLI